MSLENKRKRYFTVNKYQKKVVLTTFLPILIVSIALTALLSVFYRDLVNVILYESAAPSLAFINQWGVFIIITIWAFFILIFVWSYAISSNLLGAFERIIKDLDEVIKTGDRRHIRARVKDALANELLSRINTLIDGFSKK